MVKYAYVTFLSKNDDSIKGAYVLAYSLLKTKTSHDRIIMVTPNISEKYISYLKQLYTKVVPIKIFKKNPKFTFLQFLSFIDYDKILFLNLDLIIVKNIDKLFNLKTPAGCINKYDIEYGSRIPSKVIYRNNEIIEKINTGVMLFNTSQVEWKEISMDVSNKKIKSVSEYLSIRYYNKWISIPFNYNFQFRCFKRVKQMRYRINSIYVIHYSGDYKPWNKPSQSDEIFVKDHQKYFDLWNNTYTLIQTKLDKIINLT
jgi:lipopolysaccharide biosynthesis glycosyltransferase